MHVRTFQPCGLGGFEEAWPIARHNVRCLDASCSRSLPWGQDLERSGRAACFSTLCSCGVVVERSACPVDLFFGSL